MVRSWLAGAFLMVACRAGQSGHPSPTPARAPDDGFVTIDLHVHGHGEVSVEDLAQWCSGRCNYRVARGTKITMRAVSGEDFLESWSEPCGPAADCTFTAARNVALDVRFIPDLYRFAWARALSASDCIGVDSLIATRELVFAGHMRGTADIDGHWLASASKANDVLLAGFDPETGRARWRRLIGGPGNDGADVVALSPRGDLVFQLSDIRQHSIRWEAPESGRIERTFTTTDFMHHIRLLPDGDLIGAPVNRRSWRGPQTVTRLDNGGRARWSTVFGASQKLFVRTLIIDWPEVLVIGNLGGEPLFGDDMWEGSRDGAIDTSFLARVDLDTGLVTSARWLFSGERFEHVEDAVLDHGGNLVFALYAGKTSFLGQALESTDTMQIWLVSVSAALDHVNWVQRIPSVSPVGDVRLWPYPDGVVVSGYTRAMVEVGARSIGRRDGTSGTMYVADLASDGRMRWGGGVEIGSDYKAPAIARDSAGNIYVAGSLSVEARFSHHLVKPSRGGRCGSIYLAKLARR